MKRFVLLVLAVILAATPALASSKGLDAKLAVNFVETPVPDALQFVAATTGVHVIVDPGSTWRGRLVTVKLSEVTARAVLTAITESVGLGWDERWGGAFVATGDRLKAVPTEALPISAKEKENPESVALSRRLAKETVSFKFVGTPIPDCLEYVRSVAGMNIVIDDVIRSKVGKMAFTGSVSKAKVGDALSLILSPHGLVGELRQGVVFVRKAGPVKVAPKAPAKEGVPKVLEETLITVDFQDTPLLTVLAFLSRKTGYPFHLDPYAERRSGVDYLTVTAKADEITVRNLLDLIAITKKLDWEIRWGGVFVATKERLKALPKVTWPAAKSWKAEEWKAVLRHRLQKEKVSFDFADNSLEKVLAWIRDSQKVNILLKPDAAKAAAKTKVNLRVVKRPLGEALTLLLAPLGYTFALEHEVVVVRKAK